MKKIQTQLLLGSVLLFLSFFGALGFAAPASAVCIDECNDACDVAAEETITTASETCEAENPYIIDPDAYNTCVDAATATVESTTNACHDDCNMSGNYPECTPSSSSTNSSSTTTAPTTDTASTATQEPPRFTVQIVPKICEAKRGGCDICDIVRVFTNIANIVAGALSGLALLMFIVGGFFFIFSQGNEQRIEKGRKILTGTVVGVLIVFIAWLGVNYIIRTVYYGAYKGGSVLAGTGATQPKIFSQDWWKPTCSPALTPCAGKTVGAQCGNSGNCASGDDSSNCACYRTLHKNAKGDVEDQQKCDAAGDASAITDVSGELGEANANPTGGKQKCFCSNSCDLLAAGEAKPTALEGYAVSCIEQATYESNPQGYIKIPFSCENKEKICVASF